MPAYACNPGGFQWAGPRPGRFLPRGPIQAVGRAACDPMLEGIQWEQVTGSLAGRIIVGFNVGDKPTWTMENLMDIVKRVRGSQVPGQVGATFIAQTGVYQHKDPKRGLVTEDGGQVIIIDTSDTAPPVFERQMIDLAEVIAQQFRQETVIVEIQRAGMTVKTMGVGP